MNENERFQPPYADKYEYGANCPAPAEPIDNNHNQYSAAEQASFSGEQSAAANESGPSAIETKSTNEPEHLERETGTQEPSGPAISDARNNGKSRITKRALCKTAVSLFRLPPTLAFDELLILLRFSVSLAVYRWRRRMHAHEATQKAKRVEAFGRFREERRVQARLDPVARFPASVRLHRNRPILGNFLPLRRESGRRWRFRLRSGHTQSVAVGNGRLSRGTSHQSATATEQKRLRGELRLDGLADRVEYELSERHVHA